MSTINGTADPAPPPAEVAAQVHQYLSWVLWGVEIALIARLIWIGGRLGWEYYRPPPGPPAAPGDILRALFAWIVAASAWPIAVELLLRTT